MESVSKKPKRGRPRVHDLRCVAGQWPDLTSRRGLIERDLAIRAMAILHRAGKCTWLASTPKKINEGTGRVRFTILAALGRIEDQESLVAIARSICEQKPSSKAAIAIVRRWRGKCGSPSADGLTRAILSAMHGYLDLHPATEMEMVEEAFETALARFRQAQR